MAPDDVAVLVVHALKEHDWFCSFWDESSEDEQEDILRDIGNVIGNN